MTDFYLYGPFSELVTMQGLPLHGPLKDEELSIINEAGILTKDGKIKDIGNYEELERAHPGAEKRFSDLGESTVVPAFIDCHTHICWAGNRTNDYAFRVAGKSYLEMARAGGGIMVTVNAVRQTPIEELTQIIVQHAARLFGQGVTIIEVKSGYGLTAEAELRMLRAIKEAAKQTKATLIPTFLGAHIKPKDYEGSHAEYLEMLLREVVPVIKKEGLAKRADIFVEEDAFDIELSREYAKKLQEEGFEITMHVDQFTPGSSKMALEVGSVSADHLESTDDETIPLFNGSDTVAVALPGASLGLGMQYTPCRKLLDNNACLAIATDWNPGSAPMGDLLTQAAIIGAAEKLSITETLAAITFRAARALRIDAGTIEIGKSAAFNVFPTGDHRTIFYQQGQLRPDFTIIGNEYVRH